MLTDTYQTLPRKAMTSSPESKDIILWIQQNNSKDMRIIKKDSVFLKTTTPNTYSKYRLKRVKSSNT